MQNIHPSVCSVIPRHMLRSVVLTADDEDLRQAAAATLDQIQAFALRRERGLVAPAAVQAAASRKRRSVYDARHSESLPGHLVLREGQKRPEDVEVREAYDGAGMWFDFMSQVFRRKSIDDRYMPIVSTVHYGRHFVNAMWTGDQIVYGDGDGKLFHRFTIAPDVIGHELTHGMTQTEAGLTYSGQSGALNEHFSDVFAMMEKHWRLRLSVTQSDWIIGEGLFTARVHGLGLRSLAAPGTAYDDPVLGKDPQPAHMRDYKRTRDDNGGVHINSGIPNHAFFLVCTDVGGYSWEEVGTIWYVSVKEKTGPDAQFADFAAATVAAAEEVSGKGSRAHVAVGDAWLKVGVSFEDRLAAQLRRAWKSPPRPSAASRWRNRPPAPYPHHSSTRTNLTKGESQWKKH